MCMPPPQSHEAHHTPGAGEAARAPLYGKTQATPLLPEGPPPIPWCSYPHQGRRGLRCQARLTAAPATLAPPGKRRPPPTTHTTTTTITTHTHTTTTTATTTTNNNNNDSTRALSSFSFVVCSWLVVRFGFGCSFCLLLFLSAQVSCIIVANSAAGHWRHEDISGAVAWSQGSARTPSE